MIHHAEYLQIRLISRANHGLEIIRFDRDADGLIRVQGGSLQEKGQFPYDVRAARLFAGTLYTSPISVNHEYGAHAAQGKPTLRVGTPVANAQGAVVGVVVIDVNLVESAQAFAKRFAERLSRFISRTNGATFCVHPDAAKTFGFDVGRRVLMQDSFAVTKPLFEQKESEVTRERSCASPRRSDGQVLAFVRRPFGASEGNRFIVLGLGKPLEDVLSGRASAGRQHYPHGVGLQCTGRAARHSVRTRAHQAAAHPRVCGDASVRRTRNGHVAAQAHRRDRRTRALLRSACAARSDRRWTRCTSSSASSCISPRTTC